MTNKPSAPTATEQSRQNTPYKVDTGPIPLDTLAVCGKEECWYRIPSWRVHFDHDALRDADIRLHRSIGSHSVWTLTEATTGLKMHADIPHDQYIGDEGAMLAEFAAGRMLQLTPEKMQTAISKGKEKLSKHSPCPFVASIPSASATNAAPQEKTEGQGLNLSPVDARGEAPAVAAPGDAHGGTWVHSARERMLVGRAQLEDWRLRLSQGDSTVRWDIENVLMLGGKDEAPNEG